MSLADKLRTELIARAGMQGLQIAVSEGPRTARCTGAQIDPLAVALDDLVLQTGELAGVGVAAVESASRALCSRVNYLLEPVSPIETDADGCAVQMRSSPPQQDDNGRRYYELLMQRGGLVSLHRYEKLPGSPRVRVPSYLTHEVVGRLVDDFNTAVEDALAGGTKP